MRRQLLACLALVLVGCTTPGSQVDDGPGLLGTYVVNGVDPLGVEYSGTVVISTGDSVGEYDISWLITGAILEGTGTLFGDLFRVNWQTVEGPRGGSRGSATYTVNADGTLVGERTVEGLDGIGTEEIFPSG
jgi:hypothetical protein